MSVLVQTQDGWEEIGDADTITIDGGVLGCVRKGRPGGGLTLTSPVVAVYAPGEWFYAEVTE